MTQNPTDSGSGWNEQWQQAQRAYWDALRSMMQVNPGAADAASMSNPMFNSMLNPWTQLMQNWWNAMAAGMKGDHQDILARMTEQCRSLFGMGQQMNDLFRIVADSSTAGSHWQEALKQRFDEMKGAMGTEQTQAWNDHIKNMSAFLEMPLDTWRRMCSGATVMPGDFMQAFRTPVFEGMGEKLHGEMDKFLSVPGVGYTRESQEQVQQLGKLMLDYQKSSQDYLNAHTKLGADALDRLYRKIIALTEKGERITSLRQLYDLWVDASEEVYGTFAMSPTFRDLYGRMINALMRVKGQMRTMVDEVLGALNMPTRREMNTILKRQHELKRELRNIARAAGNGSSPPPRGKRNGADTDNAELTALRGELAALREQVATLSAALRNATKPAAAVPSAAPATARPAQRKSRPATKAAPAKEPQAPASVAPRKPRAANVATTTARKASKPVASWDIGTIVSTPSDAATPSNVTPIRPNRRAGK